MFLINLVLLDSSTPLVPSDQLCHLFEKSALLQFNNSLSLDLEYSDIADLKTASWKNDTDCCSSWDGVLCDSISGHVIGLNLSFNYLQGSLHSNSTLFSLRHLQSLILDDINFNGSPIPPHFGGFANLETLSLDNTNFSDLRSNMIQGNLPNVPLSLQVFFISNNHLYGEIPSSYCNLSKIYILDLSNNSIQGKIPSCLGNKSYLSVLDLDMNELSGEIPDDMFENSIGLRSLHLNGNQLEGALPQSLYNCKNLEVLDVGRNMINDTFPQWLEDLSMLQVLVLNSNRFHGSIGSPKVKSPFQKLKIMDLSNNGFIGVLPAKYFESLTAMMNEHVVNKVTRLGDTNYQDSVIVVMKGIERSLEKIINIFTTIDFSRNDFEGEIPTSIGKLKALKGLNFSQNKLKGSIPTSLTHLSNLEWLDLSSNDLIGKIPSDLSNLTQLSFLNLSHNKLVGPIPSGNQFDTFENDSYSGNLGLCGFPLSNSCKKVTQKGDHDSDKHDEDHVNLFDWKIVTMGYGCGMMIGIYFGYIMLFSTRKGIHFFFLSLAMAFVVPSPFPISFSVALTITDTNKVLLLFFFVVAAKEF
uniref:Leucine-rich repeat-containing N-terminal plant-type domain-containing protein n=1 Tax=Cannabis sativa TaxID=3483 RepID=A0A803Q8D3_CANSA